MTCPRCGVEMDQRTLGEATVSSCPEGHGVFLARADLGMLVAEHAGLLRAATTSYTQTLGGGQTRELYVRSERLSVYLHPIKTEYYLLLALDARSNLGQARLYGRDAARRLGAML